MLGDVHVARVVPLVVDAVVGLTLGLIAHVVVVVFVVAVLHRIFLYGRYTLYSESDTHGSCQVHTDTTMIREFPDHGHNHAPRTDYRHF